jgi:hypothetical protein
MNKEDIIMLTKHMYADFNLRSIKSQNLILDSYLIIKYFSNFMSKGNLSLKQPFDKYNLFLSGFKYSGKSI